MPGEGVTGRVLIVGVGGLGTPTALLLARAGVGTIGIADADVVELSNLNRQILFKTRHIGQLKVDVAASYLRQAFPRQHVQPHVLRVDAANAPGLFSQFDFIIDATDGVESKYLIHDAAVAAERPLSHAGIVAFSGQTMSVLPRRTACLRCLFPVAPDADDVPSCQEAGIVGPIAGAIAAVQTAEALRYLRAEPLAFTNCMLTWDAVRWRWHRFAVQRSRRCPLCA